MRLSNCFLRAFAGLVAILALTGASVPKAQGQALAGPSKTVVFRISQFVATAVKFKARNETGPDWPGPDEVYGVFSDSNPAHNDFVTSTYGDVDLGETKNFRAADRCIGPQAACDRGVSGMAFKYALWASDGGFCYGDAPGLHYRLDHGNCSFDDLIGRGDIFLSQAELLDALPIVGDVREYTVRPRSSYDFTYRISRLADVEKTIVIHFPPNVIISLQASGELVGSGAGRVTLTWTGATTSTVDIYRDGAKIVTTANDGSHVDPVAIGTYRYRVCNLASTYCSADVQVTVS